MAIEPSGGTDVGSALRNLPRRLRDRLNGCPAEGQGVHSWLFKTAIFLHQHHLPEEEIFNLLEENLTCSRPEREIREAVVNAGRYFCGEVPLVGQSLWPAVDYELIHKAVIECPARLEDLRGFSPVRVSDRETMTEEILDALYPGDPLLCLARTVHASRTRSREHWRGKASGYSFIVPNPMTKWRGE